MSTRPYQDEFNIHLSDRPSFPSYLIDPIDRMHRCLLAGQKWSCELTITQQPHLYTVRISPETLTVSTALNGETDTVVQNLHEFDLRGGIGDILLTMIKDGALPANAASDEISLDEG